MYGGARGRGKTDPFLREAMAIHNLFLEGKITKNEEKKLIHAAADRRFGRARKVGDEMDREKIIKGLECCSVPEGHCEKCQYETDGYVAECTSTLARDALALLKEQEAVKPRVSSVEQRCGNCNKVIEMDGWKACPWCGKPILWEAVGRSVK